MLNVINHGHIPDANNECYVEKSTNVDFFFYNR